MAKTTKLMDGCIVVPLITTVSFEVLVLVSTPSCLTFNTKSVDVLLEFVIQTAVSPEVF